MTKIFGHHQVPTGERMLEKDPQRVRAFDDGLMDTAGHTAGTHKR